MASLASAAQTRDLLLKLCGMLGSEFGGERAAAALQITRLLHRAGLRWDEILDVSDGEPGPRARPADRPPCSRSLDWRADLAFCQRHQHRLPQPEFAYVDELLRLLESGRASLRAADHARLARIAARLRRAAAAPARAGAAARAA